MPIPVFSIPEHVRKSIIEKFNLSDFLEFHESSQKAYDSARNVKTKFSVSTRFPRNSVTLKLSRETISIRFGGINATYTTNFDRFPLRFDDVHVSMRRDFSSKFCSSLISFLIKSNSTIGLIDFCTTSCSLEALKALVDTGRVKKMTFEQLKESDILSLNIPYFSIWKSEMNSEGVNLLLKQFRDGKRKIETFTVYMQRPEEDVILADIPNRRINVDIPNTTFFNLKPSKFHVGPGMTHVLSICSRMVRITKTKE